MNFSKIIVETVLSVPFQENGYLIYRKSQPDGKQEGEIGNTECLIVDPGLEPENFIEILNQKNLRPVAILVTHGHADHIGGINLIKKHWNDCKIYIGEEEKEKLIDAEQNLSAPFGFAITVSPADILVKNGDKLELAGIPIEVRHVPGHSKGHVVYYILMEPSSFLFAGDVIFRRGIGRSDFPDGNPRIQIEMIRLQILSLPDETIIYSGHGPATTVGEERNNNPFLVEALS
jgi:glyoxylase-like metal-dependent hydrolase (beta-lactamase superfamily II)